jgi:hypothetical protein
LARGASRVPRKTSAREFQRMLDRFWVATTARCYRSSPKIECGSLRSVKLKKEPGASIYQGIRSVYIEVSVCEKLTWSYFSEYTVNLRSQYSNSCHALNLNRTSEPVRTTLKPSAASQLCSPLPIQLRLRTFELKRSPHHNGHRPEHHSYRRSI